MPHTPWLCQAIGTEGDGLEVRGFNLWDHEWEATGDAAVVVTHPEYPSQLHEARCYRLENVYPTVTFAAAELSAGVWGFYTRPD